MWYTYILYSASRNRYYIGSTSDLKARLSKHNTHHKGFTGGALDWELKYNESYETKHESLLREKEIKKWKSRKMIEKLLLKEL